MKEKTTETGLFNERTRIYDFSEFNDEDRKYLRSFCESNTLEKDLKNIELQAKKTLEEEGYPRELDQLINTITPQEKQEALQNWDNLSDLQKAFIKEAHESENLFDKAYMSKRGYDAKLVLIYLQGLHLKMSQKDIEGSVWLALRVSNTIMKANLRSREAHASSGKKSHQGATLGRAEKDKALKLRNKALKKMADKVKLDFPKWSKTRIAKKIEKEFPWEAEDIKQIFSGSIRRLI